MIRFALACDKGHDFEAWFASSADFDAQQTRGLVTCPHCGSATVEKALMAPQVVARKGRDSETLAMDPSRQETMARLKAMVQAVRDNSEDVGDRFPEEARRIHYGESEARGIIGRASPPDARALIEEGVEIMPLPNLPEAKN